MHTNDRLKEYSRMPRLVKTQESIMGTRMDIKRLVGGRHRGR